MGYSISTFGADTLFAGTETDDNLTDAGVDCGGAISGVVSSRAPVGAAIAIPAFAASWIFGGCDETDGILIAGGVGRETAIAGVGLCSATATAFRIDLAAGCTDAAAMRVGGGNMRVSVPDARSDVAVATSA